MFDKLNQLVEIEFASRLLLAALYRQYLFNPIEYVYNSLGTRLTLLTRESPEYSMIRDYCTKTSSTDLTGKLRIFKMERKGEAEAFESVKHIGNRKLLFHGSGMGNYLGIFAQGLRIAPPEAPPTGYMFGKGVYFADTFDKSRNYANGCET